VTIGDGFTTTHDIKLNGGDNTLTLGDNATIRGIDADDGANTIVIGDGLIADDIKTGDGDTAITIGDNATLDKIETGDGDDTLSFGDNLVADDIKTGDGADALSIGDNGVLDDIDTGDGDDTVAVGDGFTADKLETKDGDDLVISGAGGSIDDLDGGQGNDTLDSETEYPGATGFEIICFARGTLIETASGSRPIEALRAGDLVRTLDHGVQRIRWINSTAVRGHGLHAPVRIATGALGNARPLWVSQQHRMLMSGPEVQLHFAEPEALIAAKLLVGLPGVELVEVAEVEYFHMLFDRHEIVFAEGIPSESFYPGHMGMGVLSRDVCVEIYTLFPELERNPVAFGEAARYVLKPHEASLLSA
jgi:peroxidase